MSEQEQRERRASDNMNFWAKQNPLLYLIVVLIMGGNGAGLVTNNSLREDVRAIGKQLDDALRRIEDQERISTMYRREIDLLDRRVEELEHRVRSMENAGIYVDDDTKPPHHR